MVILCKLRNNLKIIKEIGFDIDLFSIIILTDRQNVPLYQRSS